MRNRRHDPYNIFGSTGCQSDARFAGTQGQYAIGALMMDDQSPGRRAPGSNPLSDQRALFTIARARRDILKQSNVGVILTNRQLGDAYNRVGGVDGRIKLNQNWVSGFQAVTSSTRTPDGQYLAGPAYQAYLYRSGRQFNYQLNYEDYSPNFRTETGFVLSSIRGRLCTSAITATCKTSIW